MIKIRVEGITYYYDTKTMFMYKLNNLGKSTYYTPLNFCDIRIKQFI